MIFNMKSLLVTAVIPPADAPVIASPATPPSHALQAVGNVDKSDARNFDEPLANEYLIQFHDDLSYEDFLAHTAGIHALVQRYLTDNKQYAGVIRHFNIGSGFRAFYGHLDPEHVEQLDFHPQSVVTVHREIPAQDRTGQIRKGRRSKPARPKKPTPKSPNFNVKVHVHNAENWGQSRISHLHPGPDRYRYLPPPLPSTIYLLDTGVRKTHSEFYTSPNNPVPNTTTTTNSKVRFGPNFTVSPNSPDRFNSTDDNGHGMHTGGNTFGIVPPGHPVHLVAVKVLNATGFGTWDGVLQAIQWASNDTINRHLTPRAVINLSLGGGYTQVVTAAIHHAKVTVRVAAGNDNNLTDYLSPASCPDAITVAATDRNDTRAGFSSYGLGVDIFAPGVGILSAGLDDDRSSVYMSGTSMAAPHVAGLVAYFMMVYGAHTPEEMRQGLMDVAIKGMVKDRGEGSMDAVAYNGVGDPEEDGDS